MRAPAGLSPDLARDLRKASWLRIGSDGARQLARRTRRQLTRRSNSAPVDAAYGRASLAAQRRAIKPRWPGRSRPCVAAPQTERSIAAAGIAFDGYPSFVARETGTPVNDVYLMICFDQSGSCTPTLHVSVREAVGVDTRRSMSNARDPRSPMRR